MGDLKLTLRIIITIITIHPLILYDYYYSDMIMIVMILLIIIILYMVYSKYLSVLGRETSSQERANWIRIQTLDRTTLGNVSKSRSFIDGRESMKISSHEYHVPSLGLVL